MNADCSNIVPRDLLLAAMAIQTIAVDENSRPVAKKAPEKLERAGSAGQCDYPRKHDPETVELLVEGAGSKHFKRQQTANCETQSARGEEDCSRKTEMGDEGVAFVAHRVSKPASSA